MKKWQALAILLVVSLVAFAPSLAEARAGGSYRSSGGGSFSSQGSRGSQTYTPNGGSTMQRSMTPQSAPSSGYAGAPGYGSGFATNHPFLTGLAGGFFGGWLGSMFFPHWGMGMGYGGGFASVLGSVLSWVLIIGLIWFAIRMFTRRAASAGGPDFGGLGMMRMGYGAAAAAPQSTTPLAIAQADYQAFETILKEVQAAWSKGDLAALRHVATPEMLSYFAEELAENESRGVTNHIEQVELLRGDLRQAWDEGRAHYATCYLQWRALDYTVRNDRQHGDLATVVDGDARNPSEAAELWTFMRSPSGTWLLSAIQQV